MEKAINSKTTLITFLIGINIKVIDNFLDKKDLDYLNSISLPLINDNEIKVFHNKIDQNKNIKNSCIPIPILKILQENYHDKAISILKELNPKKIDLYDYSEFHIIVTGKNYKFPIHDDTPNKLLSGVIYLKPEKNTGTIFYLNKKGDGRKEIEWRINRAVFFSRSEKNTWHSYEADGVSNRIALVYNLMTNKIKDVYKIEKKFFLFGKLRYKINPVLYKYFGFTI